MRMFFRVVLVLVITASAYAGSKGMGGLHVGDSVYACNCGVECPCGSLSRNEGKCTCGKEMVKAKVAGVQQDRVLLRAEGWQKERSFRTGGKYVCACESECCEMISQNPGKCTCGVSLRKL